MELEIFKSSYGYYNFRMNGGKPTDEMVNYLKESGYRWSRNKNCWYPVTDVAKDANLRDDFVTEFQHKYFSQEKAVSENAESSDRTVQLEALIAELREELRHDKEKIARLENELIEQKKENLQTEGATPAQLLGEIMDMAVREEEPKAEKSFRDSQENEKDADLAVSPENIQLAKSVLPTAQYVSSLRYAQGEEREFFVKQFKQIANAVKNAPKIGSTDGFEEHAIIIRYFHPTGTETLVTEIGDNGEAFGFQCLNGNYEMAEWGYIDLNEVKSIPMMEVDYNVPEGMTVERWLYNEEPDLFPQYAKFADGTKHENQISYTQKPVTLDEILSVMDMKSEVQQNGKIRVFDEQRKEYIDNFGDEEFSNASEIFERLDVFIKEAFIDDMEDQLHAVGIEYTNDGHARTLAECCELYRKEIENGNTQLSENELNLAMGIVNPDSVIMPEVNHRTPVENNRLNQALTRDELLSHEKIEAEKSRIQKRIAEYIIKHPLSSLDISPEVIKHITDVAKQINKYVEHGTLPKNQRFSLPNSPAYLKALGADDTEISLPVSVVKKAIEKHNLSAGEINRAIIRLYDPIFAFEKEEGENQKPSLLMVTDEFHYLNENDNNPLVLSLNINDEIKIKHHTIEVQDVRTIFDKTLTAKDGTNLIDYWTKQGFCRYVDDKKISDWNTVSRNLFPIEVFQSDNNNILTKTALVNQNVLEESKRQLTSQKSIKTIREQCRQILEKSDSEITEADKLILAQYEGAGGINEENRSNAGILNEFYTPNNLVEKVWQIVDAYAPIAKTVLEPSAGVGKFANNRPNNDFTMHELDETSARINKILHPEANVIQGAYQKQFFDESGRFKKLGYEQPKYDVVIGNPPYGTYSDKYKGLGEGKEFDRYEEYFISKGLDALKDENSIMAFVVPSGFLNTASDKQKEIIASKGRLIDAYRLPVGTFPTTEVGTDIIIMQNWGKIRRINEKRPGGEKNIASREEVNHEFLSNGDWFKQHPEKILGEVKTRTNRFGKEEEYVTVHEGLTVQDELNKVDKMLPFRNENQLSFNINNTIYTAEEIEKLLQEDIAVIFNGLDAGEIEENLILNKVKVYGNPEADEKIKLLIEFDSKDSENKWREDSLFEALSEEHITFNGKEVDVNPITPEKSGTIEEYLIRLENLKVTDEQGAIKKLQEEIYDRYIAADISPAFSDREGYARKISQEIASALETKRSVDIGTIRTHLSMKNDHVSFEEKKLVKAIFEENTGLKLPEFVNDYDDFDTQMNQVIDSWAKDSRKQDKLQTKAIRTIRGFYNGDSAFEARLDHIADVIRDADMTSTDSVVMVRMIADFDTDSSHYENQRAYEAAVTDVIAQFEKMESLFVQRIPHQEEQPAKIKKVRPKKEKWNIQKSKGEVMTAEEFSHLYGRDFDEREFPIWRATDWQGNIDLGKLTDSDFDYLKGSGKYVEKNTNEWTHKVLFASGDIYAKIQEQRRLYEKSKGTPSESIFADNIALLESVKKPKLDMARIHFGLQSSLSESFKVMHKNENGERTPLNLQESFILWAQNVSLAEIGDKYSRWSVDWATANISREELGEQIDWSDIINFIDGKPVKAERAGSWETRGMDEAEKADFKAERKKEADEKRQLRSDTANRLFDRYLHEGLDDETRIRLEAEYNRRFNSYIAPDYSKLPLFVDGMSAFKGESKFKLYDQQIKGISFLCNKGNGLLAYDVGVGKTAAGIVATKNQIQTERSERPLIIVPNQVYAKWYTDIRQLFPNVQVNDLYNFSKDALSPFVDKDNPHKLNIPKNSISLCTYEALKNITFTDKSCENELFEDFSNLLSADFDGSERENAQCADKIKGTIGSASQVKNANYVFFEECGFDHLTVDEAHNFKNLWVVPRPKKKGESNEYSGIPSGKPSARALKMYGMTQLVQRKNDGRNVFMLTATPFTNSPTEVYSMLSYIGRERLKEAGITSLRSFFDEFAQTKQELGVTSSGNIDTKQVMKNWKELPALQAILTEFIDKVDGEEAGIVRPNKFTHVKPLDMSVLQKEMRDIDEERMADVKRGDSAAVIVAMNNMRLACVAPALANPAMYPGVKLPLLHQLVETSPKLKFVCDAIIDMYKDNPEKGQFMYVPLGKDAHPFIKDYLVSHGIPKEAVEIINGEVNNTPEKKEKITAKFNNEKDKLKIIIGGRNTAEGIDLNGNSFVMYNCSLGWNPSETIQAEGRIWRQGNLQGNVHVVYPVMNDSIDSVLYQKHDEKRSRINELWSYKGDSLNVEDINPEDLKLDLIKDPAKRAKLILQEETKETKAELARLNMKIKSYDDVIEKRRDINAHIAMFERGIAQYEEWIEEAKAEGREPVDYWKDELSLDKKRLATAQKQLETVNGKLLANGVHNSEEETAYIRKLNAQKHAAEEKIKGIEKNLPEIIEKLRLEQLEQKLVEYPVEKQRQILEADILNNLRPMKEVAVEIKTMRFEAMLSEKLKAGDITQAEHDLYKKAGYEKYEQWQNGEIESLEAEIEKQPFTENPKMAENLDRHMSVEKEKPDFEIKPKKAIAMENDPYAGLDLFTSMGISEEEMFVHSTEKGYVKSTENRYFNAGNDDIYLTPEQLTRAEMKRDEIIFPVLNGIQSGMYKAFNDFAVHGVFDVVGTKIDLAEGGISAEGWNQLQAAMSIYRSKEFETMRYVLIDRHTGEIRDQLAVSTHMPDRCPVSDTEGKSLESVMKRAMETDSLVVAVHNHPSGNVIESPQDAAFTDKLEARLNSGDKKMFGGHIILDHDTFNLYTSEKGWDMKLDWNKVGHEDDLVNKDFALKGQRTDDTFMLMAVAEKVNDKSNWSDDFVPVVFSTAKNEVSGVKFYDKSFFDKTPAQIRNTFQFDGIEAGAVNAFPVFTEALERKMNSVEALLFEEKLKKLVIQNAFTDAALPKSTIVEKYDIKPGISLFDGHDYRARHPDIQSTWQTLINPTLFEQFQNGAMKITQIEKPRLKKAACMGY